mmetsp:Transcript_16979/g.51546  ORF Transcript_16979/g.51546 Transcript_16979/m.51546 type:complete len:514 (+) Transcript_16979:197-1738(+)
MHAHEGGGHRPAERGSQDQGDSQSVARLYGRDGAFVGADGAVVGLVRRHVALPPGQSVALRFESLVVCDESHFRARQERRVPGRVRPRQRLVLPGCARQNGRALPQRHERHYLKGAENRRQRQPVHQRLQETHGRARRVRRRPQTLRRRPRGHARLRRSFSQRHAARPEENFLRRRRRARRSPRQLSDLRHALQGHQPLPLPGRARRRRRPGQEGRRETDGRRQRREEEEEGRTPARPRHRALAQHQDRREIRVEDSRHAGARSTDHGGRRDHRRRHVFLEAQIVSVAQRLYHPPGRLRILEYCDQRRRRRRHLSQRRHERPSRRRRLRRGQGPGRLRRQRRHRRRALRRRRHRGRRLQVDARRRRRRQGHRRRLDVRLGVGHERRLHESRRRDRRRRRRCDQERRRRPGRRRHRRQRVLLLQKGALPVAAATFLFVRRRNAAAEEEVQLLRLLQKVQLQEVALQIIPRRLFCLLWTLPFFFILCPPRLPAECRQASAVRLPSLLVWCLFFAS